MTHTEFQKLRRKQARDRTKEIETYLHPIPEPINGKEILHEHTRNGYIEFTTWNGNTKANNKFLRFNRFQITEHFYNERQKDFRWLCE